MMRSSNSKGKVVANGTEDAPLENGLSHTERLPTIQIDTVPSPPWSPSESVSSGHNDHEPPLDADHIDLQLQDEEEQQTPDVLSEEERESVRSFVEEILAEAMVVAEKKLKFLGLDDDDDGGNASQSVEEAVQEETEPVPSTSEPVERPEAGAEAEVVVSGEAEEEIRETAEKVVEEVLCKAQETVADQLEKEAESLDFPITFEDAPEDVKDAASTFIKEIVGKAITMAEEKAVPTVPFNFEDVDLIKTSGPWYVRVREGFMRVLRSACFCTPRRNDS